MKLKRNDLVQVVKGKDKGKQGRVQRVYSVDNKVLVEGINQFKKHIKAKAANQKSEIVTITKPIVVSNVAFVCPKCKKMARIGFSMQGEDKVRVCKKCKEAII